MKKACPILSAAVLIREAVGQDFVQFTFMRLFNAGLSEILVETEKIQAELRQQDYGIAESVALCTDDPECAAC